MINSIAGYVEERVLPVLKDVDKCWQPADLLPDPASDTFIDEVCIAALCCSIVS